MHKIPFSFMPRPLVLGLAHSFKHAGGVASSFFPQLHEQLIQAELEVASSDYLAIALSASLANAIALSMALIVVSVAARVNLLVPALLVFIAIGVASFFTIVYYPKIIMSKRKKLQENQLIPAMRQLLIELRSGVPLFNACLLYTSPSPRD